MTEDEDELQQKRTKSAEIDFAEDFHEVFELENQIQSVPRDGKCYEIVLSPPPEDASEIINTDRQKQQR